MKYSLTAVGEIPVSRYGPGAGFKKNTEAEALANAIKAQPGTKFHVGALPKGPAAIKEFNKLQAGLKHRKVKTATRVVENSIHLYAWVEATS